MTLEELNEERDRLADIIVINNAPYANFKAGFDAAVKLVEEKRVKPLREALKDCDCECKFENKSTDPLSHIRIGNLLKRTFVCVRHRALDKVQELKVENEQTT